MVSVQTAAGCCFCYRGYQPAVTSSSGVRPPQQIPALFNDGSEAVEQTIPLCKDAMQGLKKIESLGFDFLT